MTELTVFEETWKLKAPFVIARGARTETCVLRVTITDKDCTGEGEAVPTLRYGETTGSVIAQIENIRSDICNGLTRMDLQSVLPAGTARNAIDCAMWDLEAKKRDTTVNELLGVPYPSDVRTVQTISIGTVEEMGVSASTLSAFPMLKIKLDSRDVVNRVRAVHAKAPKSKLLIDANESWTADLLADVAPQLTAFNVALIEQPLAADADDVLFNMQLPISIGADESCHEAKDIERLSSLYDVVNIKLDKTGGLTEAAKLALIARESGLEVMVGCMLGTSLSIAPAMLLAQNARYVDLDAPALLLDDRDRKLTITDGNISRLDERLWGG